MTKQELLMKIAHKFPVSDGIFDWAEHLDTHPELVDRFELTEENAPILGWLITQIWRGTFDREPEAEAHRKLRGFEQLAEEILNTFDGAFPEHNTLQGLAYKLRVQLGKG